MNQQLIKYFGDWNSRKVTSFFNILLALFLHKKISKADACNYRSVHLTSQPLTACERILVNSFQRFVRSIWNIWPKTNSWFLGRTSQSLLKETFSGRRLLYDRLCRRALLPRNKFIVNLHQNATWAGLGDVRGRTSMPTLMCNTFYIYSRKLARPLFMSERFAVHVIFDILQFHDFVLDPWSNFV